MELITGEVSGGWYFLAFCLNPDIVAAFLAWWMPLNYTTFLAFTAWMCSSGDMYLDKDGQSLKWHMFALVGYLPMMVFAAAHAFIEVELERRKRLKRKRKMA